MRVTLPGGAAPGAVVEAVSRTHRLLGRWYGDTLPAGAEADVELTVDDVLRWADVEVRGVAWGPADGGVLTGRVEALEDDGALTVRVDDTLVVVEPVGTPPASVVGRHVRFVVRDLAIYQYHL